MFEVMVQNAAMLSKTQQKNVFLIQILDHGLHKQSAQKHDSFRRVLLENTISDCIQKLIILQQYSCKYDQAYI